jgi:methylenetetrahydrofolate reductase (NADPH)
MKIVDKIYEAHRRGEATVSFEFFPAKSDEANSNLQLRIRNMARTLKPTFVTLTWRSAFKNEQRWLSIGKHVQMELGIDVLLHLTCHLPRADLKRILQNCRDSGIKNILALRGDPPIGVDKWKPVPGGFSNALELVRMIREEHDDFFCIAVAGYPEVHTECWNSPDLPPSEQMRQLDLDRVKLKQDAGADMIITQFFLDVDDLLEWVHRCRQHGITIPIIPGYLPIQNYSTFRTFTEWCKTKVPMSIVDDLEELKNDDASVRRYGTQLAIDHCRRLLESSAYREAPSLHFFTMNLEQCVTEVLQGLGLRTAEDAEGSDEEGEEAEEGEDAEGGGGEASKSLARRRRSSRPNVSTGDKGWAGSSCEVRPIFWANRAQSYENRTALWEEYPNGRWGDSRSPAYGELTEYYLAGTVHTLYTIHHTVLWRVNGILPGSEAAEGGQEEDLEAGAAVGGGHMAGVHRLHRRTHPLSTMVRHITSGGDICSAEQVHILSE